MDLFTVLPPVGLKPNLAGKFDPEVQKFPCYGSYKLDGIRALSTPSGLLSRTLKPIPNRRTQELFHPSTSLGIDGELIVGSPNHPNVMQKTTSAVMSYGGLPDVRLYAFDRWDCGSEPFSERMHKLVMLNPLVIILEQKLLHNLDELLEFEAEAIALEYEGIMLRSPNGTYKAGRSTTKEGGLLKVKQFLDDEAVVVGFQELMHNNNEVDEATFLRLGLSKRSSHAENKVGGDMLGALLCETKGGVEFGIGTGFTEDQRREIWCRKDHYLGRLAKYKHFASGVKDAPRFPVFLGWRSELDV